MVPVSYNLRSLKARPVNASIAAIGNAIVVFSSCLLLGLVDGLEHSLTISGDPHDLIVLRQGSTEETTSGFDKADADEIATLPGIRADTGGRPMVSPELVFIPVAERTDGTRTNVLVRGVGPMARSLRPLFEIVSGRDLIPGRDECVVSSAIAKRFASCSIGSVITFGPAAGFRVVGHFSAGGTSADSEIWTDLDDLAKSISRTGTVSSVQLRASPESIDALMTMIGSDPRYHLDAIPESRHFEEHRKSANFLRASGICVSVILTIGAMFAAANTMYAAIGSRTREIGTLRAIGFTRRSIFLSFLFESVVLCGIGGFIGILATIPLTGTSFAVRNASTFSEAAVHFRIGPQVIAAALMIPIVMGVTGGVLPAIRAVRLDISRAVREI